MTASDSGPQRPRRPRERLTGPQRETQLLDMAEMLFSEHGYEGVTVDNIAQAAGVSRAIVYQHHGTKDQVFIACVRRARAQFEAAILEKVATPSDDWRSRIEAGGAVYLDLVATNPQRWGLLFTTSASLRGDLADELTALRKGTITAIANSLRPYAPDVRREALMAISYALSGIGEQLCRWWLSNPRISRTRVLAYYTAAVEGAINGILATPHVRPAAPSSTTPGR
ncbi:TetR/AcrR family transcriptional regulator [Gordonia sp. LSe1-13]|uniref:TetR/AcrR family transcriptional regulator n=1 Tax=Gordonia sesuvii TaxID=3116777 RepID=A0ABU7MIT1_9ACTN|nr:TetR/AcrR family transcriptional regulator [Gordonia sp. LSe1-13]